MARRTYSAAVKRIVKATGVPYLTIQKLYRKNPEALYRSASLPSYSSIRRSVSAYRYHSEIRRLARGLVQPRPGQEDYTLEIARIQYHTTRRIIRQRLVAYTFAPGRPPKQLRGLNWQAKAWQLKSGKNAGKMRVVVDVLEGRALGRTTFEVLRRELRIERLAYAMANETVGRYRGLYKFMTARELAAIRKRSPKKPTLAEARKIIKRVVNGWKGHKGLNRSQRLWEYVKRVLDIS